MFWLSEGMVKDTNEKHEKFNQQAYKVRKNVKKKNLVVKFHFQVFFKYQRKFVA